MKPTRLAIVFAALLVVSANTLTAQIEHPYTEGTVWGISYVKTQPGHYEDYLRDLAQNWKRVNDAAIERGYVTSYKILTAQPGHPGDWDLMLLIEYPNMAALDDASAKFDPLVAEIFGSQQGADHATVKRSELREILGGKMAREITLR